METTNEVKETLEIKKSRRSLVIDFTDKARRNLRRQQGDYQSKHGKKINLKKLAGKLLETAKLPDTE